MQNINNITKDSESYSNTPQNFDNNDLVPDELEGKESFELPSLQSLELLKNIPSVRNYINKHKVRFSSIL